MSNELNSVETLNSLRFNGAYMFLNVPHFPSGCALITSQTLDVQCWHFAVFFWFAAVLVNLSDMLGFGSGWFYQSLRWRHNGRDGVSNHQPHDCLLNRLFRRRSKKTWKLRVTCLCAGNSLGTSEFPAQMAGNADNVSIWWRHHEFHSGLHHWCWAHILCW